MRVLVFGASITQGFWDTEGGWVQRLRRYYDEKSVINIRNEDDYPDIFNLGISGNTSYDLLARFESETGARLRPGTKNGAIVLSIGTNNAYVEGKNPWSGTKKYQKDLEEIIKKARNYVSKILLVELAPCEEDSTTPVFWRDIYYTNERISAVNKVINTLGNNNNIPVVHIFNKMKSDMDNGKSLFVDGLHPNNEGHQLIFELVQPALDQLLNT